MTVSTRADSCNSTPAAIPSESFYEGRNTSNSQESNSEIEKFHSRAKIYSETAKAAIDFTPIPISDHESLFNVKLAFFAGSNVSEESFNNSLKASVEKTSRRLNEDKLVLSRSPMCQKAVAIGGIFKHSLFGILKTSLVPVALIGTVIFNVQRRNRKQLEIEKLQTKINNNSSRLIGLELQIKKAIRNLINSTDNYTDIVFIKMIKLCEAFNVEFENKYKRNARPQNRRNDKLKYLNIELTKLIQKEQNKLDAPLNKQIDDDLARSLLEWVNLNKIHNQSYEERKAAANSRRITARLEHSLTLYGLAASFLKVGTYYRSLKSRKITTPEKISEMSKNREKFSYFVSINAIFEERLKQYRDSKIASFNLDDAQSSIISDSQIRDIIREPDKKDARAS